MNGYSAGVRSVRVRSYWSWVWFFRYAQENSEVCAQARRNATFVISAMNEISIPRGGEMHLTRFCSGTCHRGFKNIPVPCTDLLKKVYPSYTNFSKRGISDLIHFIPNLDHRNRSLYHNSEIDTVLYTSMWKIYVVHPPGYDYQFSSGFLPMVFHLCCISKCQSSAQTKVTYFRRLLC